MGQFSVGVNSTGGLPGDRNLGLSDRSDFNFFCLINTSGMDVLQRLVESTQYTSEHFQELLKEQGITCSMSRAGEVRDNSAMESFFSSLKTERTARKVYRTRDDARPRVRLCRAFLQPNAPSLDARLRQSDRVRKSSRSLGRCLRDRQQLKANRA